MNYDVDLFVIGGGSGGVRAARIAASHGARVAIAEEHRWGGTCVIRGCIPKKLMVYAAELGHALEDAAGYGWTVSGRFDWAEFIARKDQEITRLSGLYVSLLERNGVRVMAGRATLEDAHTVAVGDERLRAARILIATGGIPTRPAIPGGELAVTSNEAFHLPSLPRRVTLVGGGYIGLEFAGIFRGLGAEVTLVHHGQEVLRGFDDDLRHAVTTNLGKHGVSLRFGTELTAIERLPSGALKATCNTGAPLESDVIMFATGRTPATTGLGLDAAGVALGPRGELSVDAEGRTNVPHIFGVGDCTGGLALTPVAVRDGHALADRLFGKSPAPAAHDAHPTAVFCSPPAATAGLSEAAALARGHELDVYLANFKPLFHSLSGRDERIMMKLVVDRATDRVLGAHMVGRDAPEIIQTLAIAIGLGARKSDFDRTLALHPTSAEELVLMRTRRDNP
ncbi:MAG: glutathione-disulfide reductase [Myxococcales bacterium]|nr:glutathione-disulfide reductase [Myxococcales bacterium]